jgi:DNA methylase
MPPLLPLLPGDAGWRGLYRPKSASVAKKARPVSGLVVPFGHGGPRCIGRPRLDLHPTAKPIALVADAILDCTQRDDIVLDAFVGSGTTISGAAVGVAPPHPISRKRVFLSD